MSSATDRISDALADPTTRRAIAGWVVAVLLGVAAFAVVWRSTPTGAFGATDSQTYLSVAQNIVDGEGPTSSFTNEYDGVVPTEAAERDGHQALLLWPPLYPVALATGAPFGADPDHTARTIGALGAFATALLSTRLVRRLTGSVLAALVIVVVFLANIWSVLLFATVSSEVLYVPLLLGTTVALVRAIDRPDRWRLATYVVLAATTALTRYTGASLVAAGAVALAVWLPLPRLRRLATAGLTTALAALPLVLWTLWSRAGTTGRNRSVGWYDKGEDLTAFVSLPREWVLPPDDLAHPRGWVVGSLLVVLAVLALAGWIWTRLAPTEDGDRLDAEQSALRAAGPTGLVALGHCTFVVVAGFALDVTLPLDMRMMMPVVPLLAGLLVGGLAWPLRAHVRVAARWAVAAVAVVLAGLSTARLWDVSADLIVFRDLPGLLAPVTPAATAAAFDAVPDDALVFANAPTAVYAVDRRGSITLPHLSFPMSAEENPDYEAELEALADLARDREIWIIWYIPTSALTDYMASEAELLDAMPLELVADAPEVRVYRSVPTDG